MTPISKTRLNARMTAMGLAAFLFLASPACDPAQGVVAPSSDPTVIPAVDTRVAATATALLAPAEATTPPPASTSTAAATATATATDTPSPTDSPIPSYTPTASGTPVPPTPTTRPLPPSGTLAPPAGTSDSADAGVQFIAVAGAPPFGTARVTVQSTPGASCTITYVTPGGSVSKAQGLVKKTADENGIVSWSWVIGSSTSPGKGTVSVTCNGVRANTPIIIG